MLEQCERFLFDLRSTTLLLESILAPPQMGRGQALRFQRALTSVATLR